MRGFNDDSFIRREDCERFCFYCDLSAFEQQSRFRALCNIFRAIRSAPPLISVSLRCHFWW